MKALLVLLILVAAALVIFAFRVDASIPVQAHVTTVVTDGTHSQVVSSGVEVIEAPFRIYVLVALVVDLAAIFWIAHLIQKKS